MPATLTTPPKSASHERPGQHTVLPGQTPQGTPVLSVLLKRTYEISSDGVCHRAESDRPLTPGDVPWDTPLNSSVRFESDFVPYKLATDVVLNGTAYAPMGRSCQELMTSLRIENVEKKVLVVGDRRAIHVAGSHPRFTDPQPFEKMELKYERAYGGIDVFSDRNSLFPYPRNPRGLGFVVAYERSAVDQLALPNLEDPNDRLIPDRLCVTDYVKRWEEQPLPVNFGWLPKTWLPRAAYAGVMPGDRETEQQLRQAYEALVPPENREAYNKTRLPDMDFRFFNGASPELSLPHLRGGELIVTKNLTPDGAFQFRLPDEQVTIAIDIGEGSKSPPVVLHTAMIHLDDLKLDLVWRAATEYPGLDWLPQMRKMEVVIQ